MTEPWKMDPVVGEEEPPPEPTVQQPQAAIQEPQAAIDEPWTSDPISAQLADAPTNVRGAPPAWRVMVSLAESPEDQAATLRNFQRRAGVEEDAEWLTFYPPRTKKRLVGDAPGYIAAAIGEAPEKPQTMLIYTDPDTKQRQAFDPKGFSMEDMMGDIADAGLDVARVLGAGLGLITGAAVGGPVGGYGGAIVGSQAVKYAAEPIMEAITGIDVPETRPTEEKLLERGMDVALEAALPAVGGLVAKTGAKLARAPFRQAAWKPKSMGKPEVLRDIEEMGVEQGAGKGVAAAGAAPLITKSPLLRDHIDKIKSNPEAAEVVQQSIDRTMSVVGESFLRIHRKLGGVKEKSTAGDVLKGGIVRWADKKAVAQENLENQLEGIIGKETPVPTTKTMELIQARAAKSRGMEESAAMPVEYKNALAGIQRSNGAPRFEALREARRKVAGGATFGKTTPGYATADENAALYAAMSDDLGAVAKANGKTAAETWKSAMSNWTERQSALKGLKNVINAEETEQAFNRAFSGARDGPSRLAKIKGTLSEDDWNTVVGTKLWDMATTTTTAGARGKLERSLGFANFSKMWRDLPDSTKTAMFGHNAELTKELNRFARVSASIEDAGDLINFLGTEHVRPSAGQVFGSGVGKAVFGGATGHQLAAATGRIGILKSGVSAMTGRSPMARAQLITDVDFVKWAADTAGKIPKDPAKIGPFYAERLGMLAGIAASKPEIAPDIEEYLNHWQDAMNPAEEEAATQPASEATQ